jgi:hypothetical protein
MRDLGEAGLRNVRFERHFLRRSSYVSALSGEEIARRTELGQSFVGNVVIAASTSLPEIVVPLAASDDCRGCGRANLSGDQKKAIGVGFLGNRPSNTGALSPPMRAAALEAGRERGPVRILEPIGIRTDRPCPFQQQAGSIAVCHFQTAHESHVRLDCFSQRCSFHWPRCGCWHGSAFLSSRLRRIL